MVGPCSLRRAAFGLSRAVPSPRGLREVGMCFPLIGSRRPIMPCRRLHGPLPFLAFCLGAHWAAPANLPVLPRQRVGRLAGRVESRTAAENCPCPAAFRQPRPPALPPFPRHGLAPAEHGTGEEAVVQQPFALSASHQQRSCREPGCGRKQTTKLKETTNRRDWSFGDLLVPRGMKTQSKAL